MLFIKYYSTMMQKGKTKLKHNKIKKHCLIREKIKLNT